MRRKGEGEGPAVQGEGMGGVGRKEVPGIPLGVRTLVKEKFRVAAVVYVCNMLMENINKGLELF